MVCGSVCRGSVWFCLQGGYDIRFRRCVHCLGGTQEEEAGEEKDGKGEQECIAQEMKGGSGGVVQVSSFHTSFCSTFCWISA